MIDIFNDFDSKDRFEWSIYVSKMVVSDFTEVNYRQEIEVSLSILVDLKALFMNKVCKFFKSRSSVSWIELYSKIFFRTSWVVTGSQQNSSQAVPKHFIQVSNVGWTGRCGHKPILCHMKLIDSVSTCNLTDSSNSLLAEVPTVSTHHKLIFSFLIIFLRDRASLLSALKYDWIKFST